jgi:oxygen-independent coproporphyrinogen-3 oxidase
MRQQVHTIFFGGGTPSLLTPAQFDLILNALHKNFDVLDDAEISLEANPNDLDYAYLKGLRSVGCNRLSLGVQSTHQNELKLFARRHDSDEIAAAVSAARRAGFDNLNIDLIYGAPHQTLSSWAASLDQVTALNPDHLSLYALGIEENTPLYEWIEQGRLSQPDDDLAADMYELATDRLAVAGYEQYEISNWAKPGYACRHNLQYWRNLPYIGLGPGAHGFAAGVRYWTILSPQRYIKAFENRADDYVFPRSPATDQAHILDQADEIAETLIMGLRLLQEGIQRDTFTGRFKRDVVALYPEVFERFVAQGLLEIDAQRVRLTQRGRLLSNVIFRELV